jgi:phenylalanyl-tRNA synthetase alpha chain
MVDAAAIAKLREAFAADLSAATTTRDLQAVRDRYLGRKGGLVPALWAEVAAAPVDVRRDLGRLANDLKTFVESELSDRRRALDRRAAAGTAAPQTDFSLPGRIPRVGYRHPLTLVRERIEAIFGRMGYEILDGPETEDDYHNFEALNMPREHPARDMQDTFYLGVPFQRTVVPVGGNRPGLMRDNEPGVDASTPRATPATLLRTHTSAMQIRYMQGHLPPVRVISPGRVYRRDNLDQTHTPMFQQIEGLVVGEHVTMADLKGTLVGFLSDLFGSGVDIVFRPTFFPYTEPSADVFMRDPSLGPRWLEMGGSGMVHPALFEAVGYDPERYTGFAFGMGVERIAMLLFGVDDIRQFYENDVRFLEQFGH